MRHLLYSASALCLVAAIASTAAAETTYRAASAFGPTHMNAERTYPTIFEKVSEFTEGRYVGQDFASGLVAPNEMLNGLKTGIADMGAVIMLYFPADFVESSLPGELSVIGSNPYAMAAAATEYIVTCDECLAEFAAAGQVYLGSSATAPYNIMSTKPIDTVADIANLRVRVTGAVFSKWIESLGATPVQIPSSEVYEAFNQGTIDATYGSVPELINGQLFDVVKNVNLTAVGIFCSDGVANVGMPFWETLSPEDRAAFARSLQYGAVEASTAWLDAVETATKQGEESGITFKEPNAEVADAKAKFIEAHIASVADTLAAKGVTDSGPKIERFNALVEKWHKLVEETGTEDPEALAELRWTEIYADLDYSKFGL